MPISKRYHVTLPVTIPAVQMSARLQAIKEHAFSFIHVMSGDYILARYIHIYKCGYIYLYIYIYIFIMVYMMPEIISPLFRGRGRFVVPEESRHRSLEVSARKKMAPKAAKTIAPKAENNGRWLCFGQMIFLSEINLDMNSATLKLSLGREFC